MNTADTILQALEAGGRSGLAALVAGGRNLAGDFDNFVLPHLGDIAAAITAIVAKRQAGIFTDATAKDLIASEEDAISTLVETMESLSAYEAQVVVNAIVDAMNQAVNAILGFALLA